MKKNFFSFLAIGFIFLLSFGTQLNATELTSQDKKQFIEIDEETRDGDMISKKIPAIEDPCKYGKSAYEQVQLHLKNNLNLKYEKSEAQRLLKEIQLKKFDDKRDLGEILSISLAAWACKNNYKLHKTKKLGNYFFFEKDNKGIYVAIMEDGYLPTNGVHKGSASLTLYPGLYGNDTCLQISITKLPYDPNGKSEAIWNKDAQKILNDILNFSYEYANKYYTILIQEINKKEKSK